MIIRPSGNRVLTPIVTTSAVLAMTPFFSIAFAEDAGKPSTNFGGPNAVPNQIESDIFETTLGRGIEFGKNWDAWKADLREKYGFGLGGDYTGVWLNASDTVPGGRDSTGAGIFRIFGSWDLAGGETGNTGSFVWKFEHRHG